jgi:hypothetical protein
MAKNFKWCDIFPDLIKKYKKSSEEKIFDEFCELKDQLNIHNFHSTCINNKKSISLDIKVCLKNFFFFKKK